MRLARVDALTNLRDEGIRMAKEGADSLEVRDFIDRGKKEIAFELQMRNHIAKRSKQRLVT